MKAAVLTDARSVSVKDVPEPKLTNSRDVLVKIRSIAICGTDLDVWKGKYDINYPRIMGHEATGEIAEVGSEVEGLKRGDKVVINPLLYCGVCEQCHKGNFNLCENGGLMGREVDGAFAEYVVLPKERVHLLPEDVSFEDGTTFTVLATVTLAQRRTGINPGETVAVLGEGVSGLLHTQLAKLAGARVFGVSRSQWKLDLAKKLGAEETVNGKTTNSVEGILSLTGGKGADVVIETTGHPSSIVEAYKMVKPGGKILQFAIGPQKVDGYNIFSMYFKQLTILGSRAMLPEDFDMCYKLVSSKSIDIKDIVTHTFPLDQVVEAFNLADNNMGEKVLRIVINV